jgi:transposase IS200 family protein
MQNTDQLEYQRDEHRVHLIVYHLIWCPRRRKPVLTGDIARRARQIIEEKCQEIGKTPQLDELAHECGQLYTQTLVFFWRTVRHKGLWLKSKHLMRLFTSPKLHAHTADACVQSFFARLKSWRERKKAGDPDAHPPRKRKWYFQLNLFHVGSHPLQPRNIPS